MSITVHSKSIVFAAADMVTRTEVTRTYVVPVASDGACAPEEVASRDTQAVRLPGGNERYRGFYFVDRIVLEVHGIDEEPIEISSRPRDTSRTYIFGEEVSRQDLLDRYGEKDERYEYACRCDEDTKFVLTPHMRLRSVGNDEIVIPLPETN